MTQPFVVVSALGCGEVFLSQLGVIIKHCVSWDDEHGTSSMVVGAYLDDIQKRKSQENKELIANFI